MEESGIRTRRNLFQIVITSHSAHSYIYPGRKKRNENVFVSLFVLLFFPFRLARCVAKEVFFSSSSSPVLFDSFLWFGTEKEDEWEEDLERLEGNPIDACVCCCCFSSLLLQLCVRCCFNWLDECITGVIRESGILL